MTRHAAVAGRWYPGDPGALRAEVERYLAAVPPQPAMATRALVAPHAGLMFSGPVAAYAYAAVRGAPYTAVVLVGPSHYVGFDGVAVWPEGEFETPLGPAPVHAGLAARLLEASPAVIELPRAHAREHSLEMQLPFLRVVLPDVPIVPLVMGDQVRDTITALGGALADVCADASILIVASSDLSHFFDARTAERLDAHTADLVGRLDDEGLLAELERYPGGEHGRFVACGGGPVVSVMMAAKRVGAREARVLKRSHSGEVSGDHTQVVGYLAAAVGSRQSAAGSRQWAVGSGQWAVGKETDAVVRGVPFPARASSDNQSAFSQHTTCCPLPAACWLPLAACGWLPTAGCLPPAIRS